MRHNFRSQQFNISEISLIQSPIGSEVNQLTMQCVFAPLTGPAIDLQKMPILAKILFTWRSFWFWWVCKQAKLSHLGHRKPARIDWKANAPKTSHCLVRTLVQGHNWAIFLRIWARIGRYSQWRLLSGHIEPIFVHKSKRGGYWRIFAPHSRATFDVLRPVFEDRIFSLRADEVWPPRSCDLTPLDYYLWGAIKDKCYADKPEAIDALKDNIREIIGEVQLHTVDDVLKNWTNRVGYYMASGLFSIITRKNCNYK